MRRRALIAGVVVLLLLMGTAGYLIARDGPGVDPALVAEVDACDVPLELLERVHRGHYPGRSGDIIAIEQYPAIYGNRHSTPWPYTQDVPLLLYGPGYIRSGATLDEPATVADLAPTYAELLDFDGFGPRDGRVLDGALLPKSDRNGTPKLIITLVWDGVGDNVLARWPDAWPNLEGFMSEAAVYSDATVGSSPSITPAIHSTIGTGNFPRKHGQPDIKMRVDGKIVDAWEGFSPRYLESETLGDEWDRANRNEPKVGVFARDSWHAGMIGHGSDLPGADTDLGVFDELGAVGYRTKQPTYYMPEYMEDMSGLLPFVEEADLQDGEDDDMWRDHPLVPHSGQIRYGPAWPPFQTQRMFELLRRERFGDDDMPDLFYVNYKGADLTGHEWNMDEPEMRDVVRAQDVELPKIIRGLDRLVGRDNYVLALTADHGMAPYGRSIDGWTIEMKEVTADLREEFDEVTPNRSVIFANRGYYLWLDEREMRKEGITADDIAAYLRDYRVEDNLSPTNELTPRWEQRRRQRLYLTALTPEGLEEALACARRKRG